MTKEQFDEFINEVIPQQLFHVEPKDRDDESGGQLDEVILVGLIANRPSCLKHKPLQWFLDKFLVSQENWDKMLKKNEDYIKNLNSENEEKELFRQIQEDERQTENTFDIGHHIEDTQEPHTRLIKGALGNKS